MRWLALILVAVALVGCDETAPADPVPDAAFDAIPVPRPAPDLRGIHSVDAIAAARITGPPEASFGAVVALPGDVAGDGSGDLLAAASRFVIDGEAHGVVYVFDAPLVPGDPTAARLRVDGIAAFGGFGAALSGAGDLDGDGRDDWLAGAYATDADDLGSVGAAWRITGDGEGEVGADRVGSALIGDDANTRLGWSLAPAGDLDGDGLTDIAVAGYTRQRLGEPAGAVWLVPGDATPGPIDGRALMRLDGSTERTYLGYSLAGPLVGGGVAVGAFRAPTESTPAVFRLRPSAVDLSADALPGISTPPGFQRVTLSPEGQLFVGHSEARAGAGQVSAIDDSGATRWTASGTANDALGWSLAACADHDGDGVVDVLAGAPNADGTNGTDAGAVLILSGADGAEVGRIEGAAAFDALGASVACGAIDDDPWPDVAIGANGVDDGDVETGAVYVIRGAQPRDSQ